MALQELDYRFTKRTIRKKPEGDGVIWLADMTTRSSVNLQSAAFVIAPPTLSDGEE